MTAIRLKTHRVHKPWGRHALWPGFPDPAPEEDPVGEVWFQTLDGSEPELLVKYLFTSEKLSIQVHPDDAAARAAGYPRGKDEAWVILAAEPDATIALGTVEPLDGDALRSAALDGSLEDLVDWKPARAGDVIYSPARTVHAIGAGLTLVEVQQNVDLTYRLYDYGRPRELHLKDGIAVSDAVPFTVVDRSVPAGPGRMILCEGAKFVLERWSWAGERSVALPADRPGLFVPVVGEGAIDGAPWHAGECWSVEGHAAISASPGADILFAYPGGERLPL